MKDNVDAIICECMNEEHIIIFRYDDDNDWKDVYMSYHLDNKGFLFRLKNAIRYLLGFKSKYGEFGELILPPTKDTIQKLEKVVKKLKELESNTINN